MVWVGERCLPPLAPLVFLAAVLVEMALVLLVLRVVVVDTVEVA